jgi:hypothetical protein
VLDAVSVTVDHVKEAADAAPAISAVTTVAMASEKWRSKVFMSVC